MAVERLAAWLADHGEPTEADGITHGMLERYLAELADDVSANTVAMHYRRLRAFFNWCAAEEEITASPFARLRMPKVPVVPVPVLSPADLRALLDAAKGRGDGAGVRGAGSASAAGECAAGGCWGVTAGDSAWCHGDGDG